MEKESTEITINTKNESFELKEKQDFKNIFGLFRVSSSAPTGKPTKFADQIVIYTNSTTYRLYWYDTNADVWHYINATA